MDKLNRKLAQYRVEHGRASGKCFVLAEQIINLLNRPGKVLLVRHRGGTIQTLFAELDGLSIDFGDEVVAIQDIRSVEMFDRP